MKVGPSIRRYRSNKAIEKFAGNSMDDWRKRLSALKSIVVRFKVERREDCSKELDANLEVRLIRSSHLDPANFPYLRVQCARAVGYVATCWGAVRAYWHISH